MAWPVGSFCVIQGLESEAGRPLNGRVAEVRGVDAATGRLQWSASAYPSGLPNFTATLHAMGLKYGIYGANSGVTCGVCGSSSGDASASSRSWWLLACKTRVSRQSSSDDLFAHDAAAWHRAASHCSTLCSCYRTRAGEKTCCAI
mgnify:CR=1 FL=1